MNYLNKGLLIFLLFLIPSLKSQVIINEVMSKNNSTFFDEDNDTPDWIELFNPSSNPVSLNGWGLSDDPDSLQKWLFPEITIAANSYLLIMASGKDRKQAIPYWQTLIRKGDQWRYRPGSAQIPADWKENNFDDSAWAQGPTGIGYGDGDDQTQISPAISLFARKQFQIQEPEKILRLLLHIDFDDAFVAYLNGQEIARANIGQQNIPPAWNQGADSWDHEAKMYRGLPPDSFNVTRFKSLLKKGENVLLVIDTQGGMSVKKIFPDAILIGILPPSAKEQEKRLKKRGDVNEEEIKRRLEAAKEERKTLLKCYNYRVINKEIKETVEKIKKIIEKLLEKGVKK